MRRYRRPILIGVPLGLLVLALGLWALAPSWERPLSNGASASALDAGQVRAVTLNAWHLTHPARVAILIDALRTTAGQLATDDRALPELISIQEIESNEALAALTEALEDTHFVHTCECATEGDELRNAVLLATSLEASSQRCIPLETPWPARARCAACTWASKSSPLAMRFRVTGSPDSGPMYSRVSPAAASVRSSSSVFAATLRAMA